MKIIISGGGTGGHVYPAIAIADAIKKITPTSDILFVGAEGKLEMEKVPQAGYRIEGLNIAGFQRTLTWKNLLFPFKLIFSLIKANRIIGKFKPDIAVGVGGYASGPLLKMAGRKKIPTVLQEQNSFPGVTNKLLAQNARKICTAYDGMERFFPREKIVLTGNPVRTSFFEKLADKREEAFRHFGFDPTKKTVFVFGGSLGARTINQAMEANAGLLREHQQIQVLWQVGKLYADDFSRCETALLPTVKTEMFIDRMDLAYAMADVVIGRAGALTISELCLVGKPAILVPSPNVAEDHQTKNAAALVEKNAALMVLDKEAKQKMVTVAIDLLNDQMQLTTLATNIYKLAKPDAAEKIAKTILQVLEKN